MFTLTESQYKELREALKYRGDTMRAAYDNPEEFDNRYGNDAFEVGAANVLAVLQTLEIRALQGQRINARTLREMIEGFTEGARVHEEIVGSGARIVQRNESQPMGRRI